MSSIRELVEQQLEEEGEEELEEYITYEDEEGDDPDELQVRRDNASTEVRLNKTFPETVFICGLPKVGAEKTSKLNNVLDKIIDKYGSNKKVMPLNPDTNTTDGILFVTFDSAEMADNAAKQMNGFSLDKNHTFKVVKVDEFDKITSRSEEFRPKTNVARASRVDHRNWLADPNCREQFLLRYQQETEIYWHDTMAGEPVLYYGGEREKQGGKIWCDFKVQWSPQGSYITTFHKQGINLWSGDQLQKWKVRFPHEGVKYLQFSPSEEFMLTWNGSHAMETDENAVKFFRVLTGECLRTCRTPQISPLNDRGDFPHFLWSKDGRFVAECNESTILVRDTQNEFKLLQDEEGRSRSLKYENLATFQWSPKDNIIALWTLEKSNNPARLVLVEIPSRVELAARCRTQVEAKMHWQSEGDYLCLLVTKLSKTGKRGATNLEIFRIREKNIPVDIVEVRDTVKEFAWETGGNRFAVITTDDTGHKPKLVFYVLVNQKCTQVCSLDLPSNSFTQIFWAPGGQYFVCAAITQGSGGDLLFGGLMPDNKLEILHRDEHFMLTSVEWDPSSRYVITSVTQPHPASMPDEMSGFKYQMEAGYAIWTFQGRQLYKMQKEKLFSISWRPHPPSMLSEDQQKNIKKNIKQFSKKYDALDEQAKESARKAFREDREERTNDFLSILDRIRDNNDRALEENGWRDAMDEMLQSQNWEVSNETLEEELDSYEELIQ